MIFAIFAAGSATPVSVTIDFGSFYVKSSTFSGYEAPSIGLNYESKRVTPAFLAFRAKPSFNASGPKPITEDDVSALQPDFGEKALNHMDLRPFMGTGHFTALAGLDTSSATQKAKALFTSYGAARVRFNDIVPLFLKNYVNCLTNNEEVNHLTLVFPASFTSIQRRVFGEAAEVCGYANYSELDDADAVALAYSIEKTSRFTSQKRKILFVDVGATSIKAYVIEFELKDKTPIAKRLSYVIDTNNGGSFVTSALAELMKEKTHITTKTEAEKRRLWTAAERMKNQLTLLQSAVVIAEEIGGIDRSIEIDRAEFESKIVMSTLCHAVADVARRASEGIGFDEVELIGGSSRIPIVQEALKEALKVDRIGHSMNADETIINGGGYHTQYLLKVSQFKPVNLIDGAQLFNVQLTAGDKKIAICERNKGECRSNVSVPESSERIKIEYTGGTIESGVAPRMEEFIIPQNANGSISLDFASRPFRLLGVNVCSNNTCVKERLSRSDGASIDKELVSLFIDSKSRAERLMNLKNEVEHLALRVLDEIAKNETVRTFTNHTQRLDVIRCAERQKNWVRSPEAQRLSEMRNFSSHLSELKRCIGPVYRRIDENRSFWESANMVYSVIHMSKQLLEKWKGRGNPADGPDLFKFGLKVEKWEKWFNESIAQNMDCPPWEVPKIRAKTMRDKNFEFQHEMNFMQDRYGGGGMPQIMRADGTPPTEDQMRELEKTKLMQKMREMSKMGVDPETGEPMPPDAGMGLEDQDL